MNFVGLDSLVALLWQLSMLYCLYQFVQLVLEALLASFTCAVCNKVHLNYAECIA